MTALIAERKTPKLGQDVLPSFPVNVAAGLPVAASTKIFEGAIMCMATSGANAGFVVQGQAATGLIALGVLDSATVDNSSGAAGALTAVPRAGVFLMNNSAGIDAISAVNIGQDCYIVDDNTVALSNGGGTRSRCGTIVAVDSGTPPQSQPTGVWVLIGITGYTPAAGLPAALDMVHQARVVAASALAAYTASGGVLTANANGALANIDGVAVAVGDRVLLAAGAAGTDNGVYVVTSLGSAGSKWVLTRAADWQTGSQGLSGTVVEISEGTAFANSTWKVTTTGGFTVDTTSIALYPRVVKGTQALTAGAATVNNLWILSGAVPECTDQTAAAAVKATVTAGAGSGSLALTGTTTDTIGYVITNW